MDLIWAFLSDADNQRTLSWLGGGLVVAAGGLWAVLQLFFRRPGASFPSPTVSADRGGIAVGGNYTVDRRKGVSGLEVALIVAVVAGSLLLLVVWLVPRDGTAILEGQDELLALNRRQIELLEQEKGIPHQALVVHLVRLGADPLIEQADVPTFLERFAEEFVTLRAQWTRTTNADPGIAAVREEALALLNTGDLEGARQQRSRSTREREPLDWAGTQNNLGDALRVLGARESGTATLERAVEAFEAALQEYTREREPLDWAGTQNNLGNALAVLGERESGTATLERAVEAFEAALRERTRERVPLWWAQTQENLATVRLEIGRRTGDAATLRLALQAVDGALEEYRKARAVFQIEKAEHIRAAIITALAP